jgi:DNA-binding response OmpR family regulator
MDNQMVSKILVIDDDPRILQLMELSLGRQGFAVSGAENGRVGLRLFAAVQHDLVITDILMPDMEGIETILALKAKTSPPKIIAISGGGRLVGREFLKWAKHLGADEILPKPFRMSALVALVRQMLDEPAASAAAASGPQLHLVASRDHIASSAVRGASAPELSYASV